MSETRDKIEAFRNGGRPLDLWDLIRIRVVVNQLDSLAVIARALIHEFGAEVVRLRNYYSRPRNDQDLYRAIHLTVRVAEGFLEIQVMTAAREVVCEIDHAVAFKRCLDALSRSHLNWLRRLSLAASVHDAIGRPPDEAV